MMQKRMLILCFILIFMIGCAASAKRLNKLNIGMTKAEAIELMGEPNFTSSVRDVEILAYKLKSGAFYTETYHVKIINGKVVKFGQEGLVGW